MNSNAIVWTSEGLHLNADTCVDVKATTDGTVILGQLGETWLHDLHLKPEHARWLAAQLNRAAEESELAR